MEERVTARLIYDGKVIHACEKDINELPKKNTYIEIKESEYFVESFDILGNDVLYILKKH